MHALEHCDGLIAISAPENTRDGSDIAAERMSAVQAAYRPATERINSSAIPWVMCWYPTPALAQDAGMTGPEFEDFLFGACLRDWEAEHERMGRYAALFDAAEEVRIVGAGTDLRLSLAGRRMEVDAGTGNMPGGEFFGCPVETSAEGTIAFTEFPGIWNGRDVRGIRLRFSEGRVVDASAETDEDFLLATLDTDEGARRIGELGIGCNPAITRYMGNTLLRREDRRHGPHRDRRRVRRPGRHERVGRSTGTWSRTCDPAGGSRSTAGSCRRTAHG